MTEITAYPLAWPDGWPRTPSHLRADGVQFKAGDAWVPDSSTPHGRRYVGKRSVTFDRARKLLAAELERLGVAKDSIVLSTNLKLRNDGEPYAGEADRKMSDPGIAVYFKYKGKPMVMATDRFQKIAANARSLGLAIEAMRQLERHGGGTMMERAFTGFLALPSPIAAGRHWRSVLGFGADEKVSADEVKQRYRALAAERHQDVAGGSDSAMAELNAARAQALEAVGG